MSRMLVYCMHMRETVTQWSNISFASVKLDDNVDNVVDLRLLHHFLKNQAQLFIPRHSASETCRMQREDVGDHSGNLSTLYFCLKMLWRREKCEMRRPSPRCCERPLRRPFRSRLLGCHDGPRVPPCAPIAVSARPLRRTRRRPAIALMGGGLISRRNRPTGCRRRARALLCQGGASRHRVGRKVGAA